MGTGKVRSPWGGVWDLSRKQHGVVSRTQLLALGMGPEQIRHRLERGRLHRLWRGVYAVGRPTVSERGRWLAAVLACGREALLSHRSAAALMGVHRPPPGLAVEVVVPAHRPRRHPGIRAHRRSPSPADRAVRTGSSRPPAARYLRWGEVDGIPVTAPAVVLIDLATCIETGPLEAAVNEADHLDLVDPVSLRSAIALVPNRPGAARLAQLLDASGEAMTTTELERRFLPLALAAGLPLPRTQAQLGRHRVDFFWVDLGLIVEADSLRYHRTTFKQSRDSRRDNTHAAVGLTSLRFTHGQIRHEPDYVIRELVTVARRLRSDAN